MDTYLRLRADLFNLSTGYSSKNSDRNLGKYYFENYFGTQVPGNWTLVKSFANNFNAYTNR